MGTILLAILPLFVCLLAWLIGLLRGWAGSELNTILVLGWLSLLIEFKINWFLDWYYGCD